MPWPERGQKETLNYHHVLSCSSEAYFFAGVCPNRFASGFQPSAVFTSSCLVSKRLSLPRRVRPPTNSFLFSIARPLLTAFLFESPSLNQNSLSIRWWYVSILNLGTCCYDDMDFGNLFFSLSFISSFSYIFLSFPSSQGEPVNLARKQLTIK